MVVLVLNEASSLEFSRQQPATRVRGKSESIECKLSGVPTNMLYVKFLMIIPEAQLDS
jgi:hypothetical protein